MAVSNTHLVNSPHAIGSRIVRCALIQTGGMMSPADIIQRQVALVKEAAKKGAQVICLQELATGPYFCQVEQREWFNLAEPVPSGDSTQLMMSLAKELEVVIVLPLYENDRGDFYNTAVIIDADGTYVGKYRKIHIPQADNFYEKYYFKPGNTGYPVFQTKFGRIGVYICYDRRLFPLRLLGLLSEHGTLSNELTQLPIDTLLAHSTELEKRTLVRMSFTVRVIFAIQTESSLPKEAQSRKTSCLPI